MPGSDSPPPFAIRFLTREPRAKERRVYQQALALTALVEAIIDRAEVARFHLRDRLDRNTTQLALAFGRALGEPVPSERRRLYRIAKPLAIESITILDILAARGDAARDAVRVDEAKAVLADIIERLDHLVPR